ncbi:MAG: helix-turn-helix domain-containing protein [Bacteroidaceae bacterium]|nr:helix-turn-helix domain-containing protein [Bacteroidaceae bacterium]
MDIKGVIREHGLTMLEVANRMGITNGALSQAVNGSPNVKTLQAIADVVGCKVGDFFKDEMTESAPTFKCPHCGKEIKITLNPMP